MTEHKKGRLLYKNWNDSIDAGRISDAEDNAELYLKYLIERKNAKVGFGFLEELIQNGESQENIKKKSIPFWILSDDIEKINDYFFDCWKKYLDLRLEYLNVNKIFSRGVFFFENNQNDKISKIGSNSLFDRVLIFESIEKDIDKIAEGYKEYPAIYEMKLIRRLICFCDSETGNDREPSIRKEFINVLFEYILRFPEMLLAYFFVSEYAILFNKKKLLLKTSELYEANKDFLKECNDHNEKKEAEKTSFLFAHNISLATKMKDLDAEYVGTEFFDFGDDLLRGDLDENIGVDSPARLVQKIILLVKRGRQEEALDFVEKLREIDDQNPIIPELVDKINQSNDGQFTIKLRTVDEIEKSLAVEFTKYSNEFFEDIDHHEVSRSERFLEKVVQMMDQEDFNKNYRDLIICFNMMEMPQVSLEVINRIRKPKDSKEWIEFEYLRIITLVKHGELYEGLDSIEKVLSSSPLIKDEKICFLYLKAEILREMGKNREAVKVYRMVKRTRTNYRLVERRIRELETSE